MTQQFASVGAGPAGSLISVGDSSSADAFGRLRVSNAANRFDVEFIYDKQPTIIDEVTSGGATAVFDSDARDVLLSIANDTNGTSAALYSYDVPYTPGNSQLIDITGTMNFAELLNGEAFLFLRSTVTGSTVEALYPQANWNIDTVPDINWTKSQIFLMDFQSLKVGRIRFGFVRNGVVVPVHQVFNDNIRGTGYWQSPTLPVYWRVFNDATYTYAEMGYGDTLNGIGLRYRFPVTGNATMKAICASVKSEDGLSIFQLPGFDRSVSNKDTPVTVSTTKIPVLSIRPAATFNSIVNRNAVVPRAVSVVGDNPLRYEILYRPTLTDPSWNAVDATYSCMEYDVAASAVANGIVVGEGYLTTARNALSDVSDILGRTLLSLGRTGTSDILTIAAIRTSTTDSETFCVMKWSELR